MHRRIDWQTYWLTIDAKQTTTTKQYQKIKKIKREKERERERGRAYIFISLKISTVLERWSQREHESENHGDRYHRGWKTLIDSPF